MEWPLLASLTPADRERLLNSARRRKFRRGEVIFHEGDAGESLHLIVTGRVTVQVFTPNGDVATLNVLSPGSFFGELALLRDGANRRRTATIVALEPTETLAVAGTTFHAMCESYPHVERLVATLLADRVEALSQRLLETLYLGVDKRVCRRLVELADIYGAESGVIVRLTQDDLSGMAGASRPTVNQVLQKLSTRGLVALSRGQIEILDYESLRKYAMDREG